MFPYDHRSDQTVVILTNYMYGENIPTFIFREMTPLLATPRPPPPVIDQPPVIALDGPNPSATTRARLVLSGSATGRY